MSILAVAKSDRITHRKPYRKKGEMKMKKVRIGVVGAGFVSHLHMNAFSQIIGVPVEVLGVVSGSRQSAEKFAEKYGVSRVYDDYQSMLEDPDIDVVDICAPNIHH